MWQESNISKKSQRIILRYLSIFLVSRLVVSEHFWTKSISNILPVSLGSLYCQEHVPINLKVILSLQLILLLGVIIVKGKVDILASLYGETLI